MIEITIWLIAITLIMGILAIMGMSMSDKQQDVLDFLKEMENQNTKKGKKGKIIEYKRHSKIGRMIEFIQSAGQCTTREISDYMMKNYSEFACYYNAVHGQINVKSEFLDKEFKFSDNNTIDIIHCVNDGYIKFVSENWINSKIAERKKATMDNLDNMAKKEKEKKNKK